VGAGIVQAYAHRLVRGVLGRVDQRLLRGPGQGEGGIGRQRTRLAADLEGHPGAVTALVVRAELGQPVRERPGLAAQGVHGPAGLVEPVGGQPASLAQQLHRLYLVMLPGEDGLGGLDVQSQGAEGVGEHVVNLPGDPGALIQRCHLGLLLAELIRLGEQGRRLLDLHLTGAQVVPDHPGDEQNGGMLKGGRGGRTEKQPLDLAREYPRAHHDQPGGQAGVAPGHQRGEDSQDHEFPADRPGRCHVARDRDGREGIRQQEGVPEAGRHPEVGTGPQDKLDGRGGDRSDRHCALPGAGPGLPEGDKGHDNEQGGAHRQVRDP